MEGYISTPLTFMERGSMGTSVMLGRDLEDRISMLDNLIELIVFTPRGSFAADPDFGFEYWNHEYSNIHYMDFNNDNSGTAISYNEVTKRECQDSIRHSLLTYYPQLKNVAVLIDLAVADAEKQHRKKVLSKYSVKVTVKGTISDGLGTNRDYSKDVIFLVEPTAKQLRY
ncbi:MAG: hypothetical protein IJ879_00370 [Muribaculaceae bacterium]|jgi:hypothetical protein|nr:hypothetical protein [Muribaculaceae bacterium]